MSKMDGYASRTAADIERKHNFGKSFAEVMGVATDARTTAIKAEEIAKRVEADILNIDVVKELNASAGTITLQSNGLVIQSDNFSLSSDGGITATKGNIGKWNIESTCIKKTTNSTHIEIIAPDNAETDNFISVATYNNNGVTGNPLLIKANGNIISTGSFISRSTNAVTNDTLETSISAGKFQQTRSNGTLTIENSILKNSNGIDSCEIQMGSFWARKGGVGGILINGDEIWFCDRNDTSHGYIMRATNNNNLVIHANNSGYIEGNWTFDKGGVNFFGGEVYCESPFYLENNIYSANGEIILTSDRNAKNSIADLSDAYGVLFDDLRPVIYRYNNGTSNRLHTGFIAQEVYEAMENAGLSSEEFACVCIDHKDGAESWGIRYSELIPLCVKEIQKLKARIAELEKVGGSNE